jgi:hypothetical protein
MWGWWASLESVTRFRWWTSFLAIIIPPLLASLLGGLAWWSGNRRDYLKTQREQELQRPRQLSHQQREQFLTILKETPYGIGMDLPIGDPEAFTFGKELQTLFNDAGWTVGGRLGETTFDPPRFGIEIEVDLRIESQENQETPIPEISVLERVFHIVGMTPKIDVVRTIQRPPYKFINLHVGHKPKPSD